jgi:hypothetical protein
MIFAFATDDRTLHVFPDEPHAIAHAEGIDVEDGVWLFFAEDGEPLEPVFITPNEKTRFTVCSGTYRLQRNSSPELSGLVELLPKVAAVEGEVTSVEEVRRLLTK